jgi:DNA (cytosine-5)-methyltransferase 1
MIRHLDLFSGIGGFALAARWTGVVRTVGFVERDPWCQRVIAKHWPEVPIHDDITTLTGDALARFGRIDFITGGFPCQPYSVAGKRGGAADDRALWPAMAAVIAESRPAYVLAENVPGIVSMELDVCLADLEALGYACRAVVVPALGVDAPHRRERVWILAHDDRGAARQPERVRGSAGQTVVGIGGADMANANGRGRWEPVRVDAVQGAFPAAERQESASRIGPSGANVPDTPGITKRKQANQADAIAVGRDARQVAGGGSRWQPEPALRRVVDGLPSELDKHRLRGLGNAIVPQVAYELMRVMFADSTEIAA